MRLSDIVTELRELWENQVHTVPPSRNQFYKWLYRYRSDVLEEAIFSTALKVEKFAQSGISMPDEEQARYCSGTAKHIALRLMEEEEAVQCGI